MATEVYSYDSNGRLTSIDYGDGARSSFAYDDLGNRSSTLEEAAPGGGGQMKYTIYSRSGSFAASDGSGSYYRIVGTATVTMPASPGDGSVYKFKVLSGTSTFAFNGSDTINHADGISDQNLVLETNTGVIELIAVPGGYDET